MPPKIEYAPGEQLGSFGVIFLKDVESKGKHRKAVFLCPQCGAEWITRIDSVKNNKTTNCGCVRKQKTRNLNFKDLTGLRFGKFVVIKETDKRSSDGTIFWECRCDCGNIVQVRTDHLNRSGVTSCGCRTQSIPAEKIENILKQNSIKYIKEKCFKNCINPKTNAFLRFDFYLPEYNMCIEYDGEQHFKNKPGWEELDSIQFRDDIKNQYCISNNIKLIRISYKDKNKINNEFILSKIGG